MTLQELFNSPEKWNKGFYAKNSKNEQCPCNSSDAISWCLLGGVDRCYPLWEEQSKILRKIYNKIGLIWSWNDAPERTFEDVQLLVKELNI